MIHLTPNLVAVQVPEEAQDAYIDYGFLIYNLGEDPPYEYTEPLVGNYRFLGLCTSSGPEFDAEAYVECISRPLGVWRNYLLGVQFMEYLPKDAKGSFLTLMQSAGCWFENPIPEPEAFVGEDGMSGGYDENWVKEYESAQSQSSPKWAILEKL